MGDTIGENIDQLCRLTKRENVGTNQVSQGPELVAFPYTRNKANKTFLGIGLVCNYATVEESKKLQGEEDRGEYLHLSVLHPSDAKKFSTTAFNMSYRDVYTVKNCDVLARNLAFMCGKIHCKLQI